MGSTCAFDFEHMIKNELTQGIELAQQLRVSLGSQSSPEEKLVLIQRILSTFDKALWTLKRGDSAMLPESSISIDDSPQSVEFVQPFDNQQEPQAISKKRKALPIWTDRVRLCTDHGLEGNTDDGYSWRKYGQKDILGAKFPRSYYRCTYRYVHNCMARKQVQRADEDPTVFEITYRGKHTCNHTAQSVPPPTSPEKHDVNQTHHHHNHPPPPPKSGDMLSNLRENLRVSTSDLDATVPSSFSFPSTSFGYVETCQQFHFPGDNNEFLQGYSPLFISPATSGSNCFPEWGNDFQHFYGDSNETGMISTTASATNSPLAFPSDPQDFGPNFVFNNLGFL